MQQKNYLRSAIKKFTFDNGETILNCSFKLEDLQKIAKNGWIRLKIAERKNPSEKGFTHYAYEDPYVPAGQPIYNKTPRPAQQPTQEEPPLSQQDDIDINEIPF